MFTLSPIPYTYDALEPHIDARTMEIHHTKHHQAYTDKLNAALTESGNTETSIENILRNISSHSTAVRNNAGGFYNHNLFWEFMTPGGANMPSGELAEKINQAFGSFENFKEQFTAASMNRFGSGWAWLVKKNDGTLAITSTANQDNPMMDVVPVDQQGTPILGLDVWEHAYYLNYQNKRADYVQVFFSIINWDVVLEKFST
jgi:Fe-Mn family superoxide dismutase